MFMSLENSEEGQPNQSEKRSVKVWIVLVNVTGCI